ncbi:hypothetical protein K1T71_002138 [Dendrolimus kikuchii]|uniref:Uncharacterized protein n=1 Tax=Dendrolimus kikuchii TaxID=765133 RepID=A0ACC1DG81_9NEOP|nr:hypothetical protein K1T71_002138 [Dendrolimus kikuchii]
MRVPLLLTIAILLALAAAAPAGSKLQTGPNDVNGVPYVEEVVVESVLQVRPSSTKQARVNTQVNLQDGARVDETKNL